MGPKVLVLRTAGTNCDYETEYAFQLAGAETALVHINRLIAGRTNLNEYHILAIPGDSLTATTLRRGYCWRMRLNTNSATSCKILLIRVS